MSLQTFRSTVAIFSFVASFMFYWGLVILIAKQMGAPGQLGAGIALLLTLIAGFSGFLQINYIISVLAFGFLGALFGGAGFGSGIRHKLPGQIAAGILTAFLFLASFVAPNTLEIRCLLALLMGLDAYLAKESLARLFDNTPEIFAMTMNGPFQLLALFGGFLVLPVLAPWWIVGQPLIFILGALGGAAGADLD
jgi:hypothetical protein